MREHGNVRISHNLMGNRRRARLRNTIRSWFVCGVFAVVTLASIPKLSMADEGGVSFWVPGFFGSLAAAPQQPGWSWASIYYHTSVSGNGALGLAKEFEIKNIPFSFSGQANLNVKGTGDLGFVIPTYVFATPVLGGQASVSLAEAYGTPASSLDGTVTGTVTGPLGNTISFMKSGSINNSMYGFSDLIPIAALRWNSGLNNYMTYIAGDVPIGAYDSSRLANTGIGHGAIDAGAGYTYFNPQTGRELSGVLGFTYNLVNPSTQYQNGVDMHFDWGASQFLTKQLQVGLVGYAYKDIGCDSGSGDHVGCFQSQVLGVGPQIGYLFPIGGMQGYLNLKAYGEFDGSDRASGWNAWVTLVISPAAPTPAAAQAKPIITK